MDNKNVSLEEAQNLLLEAAAPVNTSRVSVTNACGRVLGKDIIAKRSIPHFEKSAMDGYAVIAADTQLASPAQPTILRVIEEIRAGVVAEKVVSSGTAIKVMTGAPIPPGADTVIKYEDVVRQGGIISISRVLHKDDNVVPIGEDVKKGDIIVLQGTMITAPMTAVFAGLGINNIPVYRKVKIAISSTGDELASPSQKLQTGKIYNSSFYGLSARCRELGANPIDLGICPDEVEITAARIIEGLEKADIVITTGGVSVGDFDVVKESILRINANLLFRGVSIKPGSPMLAAVKDGKIIIGLSGNPAAAMVTFDLIVAPLIKKLMGMNKTVPPKIQGIMAENFSKPSSGRRFLRAQLMRYEGQDFVKLAGAQANGVLMSLIDCNVLVDIPAGSGPVNTGQVVSGFLIDNIQMSNEEFINIPAAQVGLALGLG